MPIKSASLQAFPFIIYKNPSLITEHACDGQVEVGQWDAYMARLSQPAQGKLAAMFKL